MAKTEWYKLMGNPSPDFFACIDGPITIDEETVVLYSKKEPNRIGKYYSSGNYRKIIKAEWRQDKNSSKFVYILHEDNAYQMVELVELQIGKLGFMTKIMLNQKTTKIFPKPRIRTLQIVMAQQKRKSLR